MADAGHWSDLDRSGSTIYQHATTNALSVRTTPGASAASRTRVIFHREGFLVGIVTVIANAVVAQLYRRNLILNILNINVIYQLSTKSLAGFTRMRGPVTGDSFGLLFLVLLSDGTSFITPCRPNIIGQRAERVLVAYI